ncbi:hypothetical protein [Empedobacter brevis]|uniref:hypothetical protein n=1 Tax=Empedobacter brevis TaxID=247 RepID=UPI002FE283CD
MGKIFRIIDNLSIENRFSIYLPIFRVFISFHILKKMYLGWSSISLLYGDLMIAKSPILNTLPFLAYSVGDFPLIILLTILVSLLFAFGIGRWFTALLLYMLMYFNNELSYLYSNGGDNLLSFICLYMIFTNSYNYFVLNKSKISKSKISNLASNLACYSIMIHLCLIYFVSFIHKIHSDMWYNGVANYYILNLERYSSPFNHIFSKNMTFIVFSTYFTLAFELFFPILVWNKKLRNILLISGIFLHLGIYFFMMIYDFEILFIMIYGFFITNSEWSKIFIYIKEKTTRINIKYLNLNKK